MVRVKPRFNEDVNQWWLCDEGRYGLGWLDQHRLGEVRGPSAEETGWDETLTSISAGIDKVQDGSRIGVIASTQLTTEELFLIREIFQRSLGARVTASVPEEPGSCDDFLIKADKNPNTRGATLVGLLGPDVPGAEQLVDEAIEGNLDVLWVFGHDLVKLFGEEKVRQLSEKLPLFVFSGTNDNSTVPLAQWVLPSAAYVEKDGTFVNCHGRLQRIGRAFAPLADSREDWRILLELAEKLGLPLDWQGPEEIFAGLAESLAPFQGLSYDTIGTQGVEVAAEGMALS
jgi:NADH-quinone oxidoreductase subunit G